MHRDKLIRRLNSNTFLSFLDFGSVKYDTSVEILSLIDKRVFNGITQKFVAESLGISMSKVKRFEKGEVDSLRMYKFYVLMFDELPNKKIMQVPKWVYS